jgi:two-component SAPR family response regulator
MSSQREQVIIVDDDADLALLFTETIKSSGIKAIGFEDPLKAVKHIEDNHSKICLVVTDWKMPDISGLELTKKVADIDNEIGIMLMSAYELDHDQLREVNKDDYLKKPIHMEELTNAVKREYYARRL